VSISPFPFVFWRQPASGNEPAREWLQSLNKEGRRKMGEAMRTVELGWPLGMPLCRPMGGGLHELRVSLKGKQEARLLFCP
jgi:phage-related protein